MRKYIGLILLLSLSCSDLDKEMQVENVLKLTKEVTAINQEFEKLKIDSLIESLRIEQSEHDIKRALALQLVEACPNIHKSDGWTELVRTENEVVMARVTDVFTLIEQSLDPVEIENLGSEIETLRGEQCRDMVLKSLMSSKFIDVAKN